MSVIQLDAEHDIGQHFDNLALELYQIFLIAHAWRLHYMGEELKGKEGKTRVCKKELICCDFLIKIAGNLPIFKYRRFDITTTPEVFMRLVIPKEILFAAGGIAVAAGAIFASTPSHKGTAQQQYSTITRPTPGFQNVTPTITPDIQDPPPPSSYNPEKIFFTGPVSDLGFRLGDRLPDNSQLKIIQNDKYTLEILQDEHGLPLRITAKHPDEKPFAVLYPSGGLLAGWTPDTTVSIEGGDDTTILSFISNGIAFTTAIPQNPESAFPPSVSLFPPHKGGIVFLYPNDQKTIDVTIEGKASLVIKKPPQHPLNIKFLSEESYPRLRRHNPYRTHMFSSSSENAFTLEVPGYRLPNLTPEKTQRITLIGNNTATVVPGADTGKSIATKLALQVMKNAIGGVTVISNDYIINHDLIGFPTAPRSPQTLSL